MPNCCGKCWGEFRGWLKAFTRIESLLTLIEAIFLILFIVFLVFLILHFLACGKGTESSVTTTSTYITAHYEPDVSARQLTGFGKRPTCTYTPVDVEIVTIQMGVTQANVNDTNVHSAVTQPHDVNANVDSVVTQPKDVNADVNSIVTQHQVVNADVNYIVTQQQDVNANVSYIVTQSDVNTNVAPTNHDFDDVYEVNDTLDSAEMMAADLSDGVLADDDERQVVLALVRIKPSGLTFGCILTVVAEHWTVTAASCIDSIEEVDSLDNFVMMDDYGESRKGRSHPVSDVRVHPLYEGGNSSFDLALLKTDDPLKRRPVALPSMLDYFRMTIGETAHILGFGHFRTIDHSSNGRRVHSATVHLLPAKHCQLPRLEERHLLPAAQEAQGRCGPAPICLGVLYARGTPCNYCAGAPLLRTRTLLGVMADNGQCGAACEPARYANIAAVREWLLSVVAP